MKRMGYRFGVAWIAENDEPEETDLSAIAAQISVLLLADLFCKEPTKVAADVKRWRRREWGGSEHG